MNCKKKIKSFVMLMVIGALLFSTSNVFAAGGNGSGGGDGNGSGAQQDTTEVPNPTANSEGSGDRSGGGKDDPLVLLSASPTDGTKNIPVDTKFDLQFNKNIVNIAVKDNNAKMITLWQDAKEISIDLLMVDDQIERDRRDYISVSPQEILEEGKTYTLKIDPALQSKSGSTLADPLEISYTTLVTEKPFNMTPVYIIIGVVAVAVIAFILIKKNKKN